MQFLVFRRICADGRCASARIAIVALEAGSVALAREAREPDAGCSPCAPAMKAPRHAREGDAEDLADLLEVGIDRSVRSEEHTSELRSLMRTSYTVFCLIKKNNK